MTLGDYIDRYTTDGGYTNAVYETINVIPFNYYQIKDFIKMDLTLENKVIDDALSTLVESEKKKLVSSYYESSKTKVLHLLRDNNIYDIMLLQEFEKYFKINKVIKSSDELIEMLTSCYTTAKKLSHLDTLKELQTLIKEKIEETENILS